MAITSTICWFALCLAQPPREEVFWDVSQRQQAGAAAQLILAREPLTAAILRLEGFRWKVWREPEFRVIPLRC